MSSYGKRLKSLEGKLRGRGLCPCPDGERVQLFEDHGDGRGPIADGAPSKGAICERCGRERETHNVVIEWFTPEPMAQK